MHSSTSSNGSTRSKISLAEYTRRVEALTKVRTQTELTLTDLYAALHALQVSAYGRCDSIKCLECNPLLAAAQRAVDDDS